MSSLCIKFNDEYPRQGHYRTQMINIIKTILEVDPDIFGSSLTLSYYYKGSTSKWNYMSGRFDSHQVNELDECLITSDKIFYNYGGVELN